MPAMPPSLRHKCAKTLSPLWDFRVLLLFFLCALLSCLADAPATMGLLSLSLCVICAWGAALLVTKMILPHVSMSELYHKATWDSRAAALVYLARIILLVAVAISLIIWSK